MKDKNITKQTNIFRRKRRTRAKMTGTTAKPRLSVFRSLSHIYAQAIDDIKGVTLAATSDLTLKAKGKPVDVAKQVGEAMGQALKDKKITQVVFDKGPYKYHGRVKALAEGVRSAGIKF